MLLDKLKLKQGQLSDYQFADKLDISHQLWQMTRTGKREIGLVILKAILKAYPKLDRDVLIFLRGEVVIPSTIGSFATDASQPSQDGKIARLRAWLKGFIPWVKPSISKQATKSKSKEGGAKQYGK